MKTPKYQQSAFTLLEVIVALAIVATLVVALVGLLGPALDQSRDVLVADEVFQLSTALEAQLVEEEFSDLYGDFVAGEKNSLIYFTYHYRGDPDATSTPIPPVTADGFPNGQKIAVARRHDKDPDLIEREFTVLDGGTYYTALSLSDANPLQILPTDSDSYPEAVIVFRCQFFNTNGILDFIPSEKQKPIYTVNIGVSR